MKRGFTILELLVASLLLGMLMTVLTMIFNQSSIAWRTGLAGVADLDSTREGISEVRYKADDMYEWDNKIYSVLGVFNKSGDLRINGASDESQSPGRAIGEFQSSGRDQWSLSSYTSTMREGGYGISRSWTPSTRSGKNYIINVQSFGPDRSENTYDDIWSIPDDPGNW